jgi:histidinol-phosphate phosphatase family protein
VNAGGRYDVVVPTTGRPSLGRLLRSLAAWDGPLPGAVVVVDDRRAGGAPLPAPPAGSWVAERLCVVRSGGHGPAAARNAGWRAASAEWVAFLDDDVTTSPDWPARLVADLEAAGPGAGASQGRIRVPLPAERRPTDWERNVAGLERARWATADMAYQRAALARVGGFDERFPHAYREDADLALRVAGAGFALARGRRETVHPVPPAGALVSVRLQRGNASDPLMRALHGRDWRERAGVPRGRRRRHLAVTAAGALVAAALVRGHRRAAAAAGAGWLAGTAELAWARIAPGPRTPREVATMCATSVIVPPAAAAWWLVGIARLPRTLNHPGPRAGAPAAVLLDRDGTLVVDVPYNGDPARVVPVPGAGRAVERLRRAGVPMAVVSNQSGVARGLVSLDDVHAVNRRVEELLGPIGPWLFCPHGPDDGCDCRKPAPGMVVRAARALGVDPARCALIGDTGADVDAAVAAGARAVLVPNAVTRREEVHAAPEVAESLEAAVDLLLGGTR